MDRKTHADLPDGFGRQSKDILTLTDAELETVASDAEKYRESLSQDIALSKEAVSARNRLFLSALLTIIAVNSDIKEVSISLFGKVAFNDGIEDVKFLAIIVTAALGVHYAAAAVSEYLAEHLMRRNRSEGIERHLTYLSKARIAIQMRQQQKIQSHDQGISQARARNLTRFQQVESELTKTLIWLRIHHYIAIVYNVATPTLTIIFVIGLVIWTVS